MDQVSVADGKRTMSTSGALAVANRPLALRGDQAFEEAALAHSLRGPRRLGFILIVLFIGGFFAWGATVPIAGGAIANGVVSPDGSRRTVQHLEGGIIASLLVKDGDRVVAGQRLLALESVQARTTYNALLNQYYTLLAMEARLRAEQDRQKDILFPQELLAAAESADVRRIIDGQRVLFNTRRAAHDSKVNVLRQKIEQADREIQGYEAQVASTAQQLALIANELEGKNQLLRLGLVPKPDVLRLQRAEAEIQGKRGEYLGMIARSQQVIGESVMQILSADADRLDKISDQMDKVRVELASVTEKLQASRDVLARTAVVAPISGTVVGLKFKTVEGVIRPGEPIMDIVPEEEKLLIDAKVAPNDIDVVHSGLSATVRLTAYSSRGLPRIPGIVRSVSADSLTDDPKGQPYYLARVEVDRETLAKLRPAVELVPGMPAEVLIVRRERTMIEYLIEPLRDAFRRSFHEV